MNFKIGLYILFFSCAITFGIIIPASMDRSDKITSFLIKQGYTNVQAGSYSYFGCGRDDYFRNSFKATNPNGIEVEGYLCEGLFKGKTIRLD